MLTKVSAKNARDNFTDLLGLVYYGKQSVVVEKKGRPFAVVVSPDDFASYQKAAKGVFFEVVKEIQKKNLGLKEKEVFQDITAAVNKVRGR